MARSTIMSPAETAAQVAITKGAIKTLQTEAKARAKAHALSKKELGKQAAQLDKSMVSVAKEFAKAETADTKALLKLTAQLNKLAPPKQNLPVAQA